MPRNDSDIVTGADSNELAPTTCDSCNSPIFSDDSVRLVRSSGFVDGVLCHDCATKVRDILLDLDKIFIVVDPKLLEGYTKQVLLALQQVVQRRLYCAEWHGEPAATWKFAISITEGSQPGELIVAPGRGVYYRWSNMRDDLEMI